MFKRPNIPYDGARTLSVYPPKTTSTNGSLHPIILLLPTPTSLLPSKVYLPLIALHLRANLPFSSVLVHPTSPSTYPHTDLPSSVRDVRRLLVWIENHAEAYGGDKDRVHVLGWAGGAVVALWAAGVRDSIIRGRERFLAEREGQAEDEEYVGNGLRRVEVWEGDEGDSFGKVKGLILFVFFSCSALWFPFVLTS